jgi:hypothetical protein
MKASLMPGRFRRFEKKEKIKAEFLGKSWKFL